MEYRWRWVPNAKVVFRWNMGLDVFSLHSSLFSPCLVLNCMPTECISYAHHLTKLILFQHELHESKISVYSYKVFIYIYVYIYLCVCVCACVCVCVCVCMCVCVSVCV